LFKKSKKLTHNATLVWLIMAPTDGRFLGDYWSQEAIVEQLRIRFGVLTNTHAVNTRMSELVTVGGYVKEKRRSSTGNAYEYRISSRPSGERASAEASPSGNEAAA